MKKFEIEKIKSYANSLSNEELEKYTIDCIYDTLGSETEEMYERGYDILDIMETEKIEKFNLGKSQVLIDICLDRGIDLF